MQTTIDQLRRLIGRRVRHEGVLCTVIELIEEGPALVLLDAEADTVVQEDQFGSPRGFVAPTFTVPVFAEGVPSPAFAALTFDES